MRIDTSLATPAEMTYAIPARVYGSADSIMTAAALVNVCAPSAPRAARMPLACDRMRTHIRMVTMKFKPMVVEKYAIPTCSATPAKKLVPGAPEAHSSSTPKTGYPLSVGNSFRHDRVHSPHDATYRITGTTTMAPLFQTTKQR